MEALVFLIPIALGLGVVGLAAFIWALKSGQFEDLDGAAMRILNDDSESASAPAEGKPQAAANSLGSTKSAKR
jgi:cbb3-type cytochrome oxidase maturation protein